MILLLFLLLVFSSSCTPVEERVMDLGRQEPLVWPQPPEEPRIKFLYAFRDPKDLGFPTPFFKRLWGLIVGEEDQGMIRPYAVAVKDKLIAVADPGARALHLFDTERRKYKRITTVAKDSLLSPVGVAIAGDRIYLSDSASRKVFALDTKGRHLFTIQDLARPTGLAFGKNKMRLYVADTLRHRIDAFDRQGRRLFSFGKRGEGKGELNYPTHLFLRGDTLYVNDTMNFRFQSFDLEGTSLSSFGRHGDGSGDFAQPKGVGVDGEGNVYVVDALFDRVQIFDARGRFLLAFGRQGGRAGEFWLPSGLFIARDRIYVADSYNRRVQVFQFLGGS